VIETRLKLGLLGTGLAAYRNGVINGAAHRRIFVVPATINYRLVLEAETLIEDYLAETGKSRYIIEDDEFSRIGRIFEFVRKTLVHEGSVVIRFGRPIDPFGNAVDDAGESVDRHGRRIDPSSYLLSADGQVGADEQREGVYTRELGEELSAAFRRETVLMSTHLVARATFDAVVDRTKVHDIYRLLRLPPSAVVVDREDVCRRVDALRRRIAATPEHGRVEDRASRMTAAELLDEALRALTTYHTYPVLETSGDSIRVGAMKLCYYYRNRTAHIGAEEAA
jgi:glycerol-3-phosphate O-acyltransferase